MSKEKKPGSVEFVPTPTNEFSWEFAITVGLLCAVFVLGGLWLYKWYDESKTVRIVEYTQSGTNKIVCNMVAGYPDSLSCAAIPLTDEESMYNMYNFNTRKWEKKSFCYDKDSSDKLAVCK